MLLRASGEREDIRFDLTAVTRSNRQGGVAHGRWLSTLTEQALGRQWRALAETRRHAAAAMGDQQTVDALLVASAFNGITRVADATGIPLDESTREQTDALRADVGLDAFAYDAKQQRYGGPAGSALSDSK